MAEQPLNRGGPLYWLKRRSRRFWIIAIALLPLWYVVSFGPACWVSSRTNFGNKVVAQTYWPLIQGIFQRSEFDWFYQSMHWYSRLAADKKWRWGTDDLDGHGQFVWEEI